MKKASFALIGGAALGVSAGALAATVTLTLGPLPTPSMDGFGSSLNAVYTFNIGAGSHVVGYEYELDLITYGASWASEARFTFTDDPITAGVHSSPGFATGSPLTTTTHYSSGGYNDLVTAGLDFNVGANGILRVEFNESYDDAVGVADADWLGGFITFHYDVPAPGALALPGLAGLARRRRR